MLKYITYLLLLLVAFCSPIACAVTIEADGQAMIFEQDIISAREDAIRDASQQASMQAAVYVSSSQVVRDGILEIDNMQISTLGTVTNIEVIEEKRIENMLYIRIRADVEIDTGCDNGVTNTYTKSIAFTAFPLVFPKQANLGGLYNIGSEFPAQLGQQLESLPKKYITGIDSSTTSLFPTPEQAGSVQLDSSLLSNLITQLGQQDVNYIVAGVIRDISMINPKTHAENNFFIDLYNKLDYKSKRHLRNFQIELFVYDGYTGSLVSKKQYQTAGLWNLDSAIKTGFATAGFARQPYGKKVIELEQQITQELADDLRCKPFTARIIRVDDRSIWINAGSLQGIKQGDKMTVFKNTTFYMPNMKSSSQTTNTRQTLIIDNVQANMSSGRISNTVSSFNINSGDLVIAR